MPNELTNPNNVVTEERLAQFYQQILPYLGGMPDVLANKFNRADLYSTDEKLIGRWVNGKPIYSKVITGIGDTYQNWNQVVLSSDVNVDQIIDAKIISSDRVGINGGGFTSLVATVVESTGAVKLYNTISHTNANTAYAIQYTKTTDSAVEIGDDTDYSTTEKIVGTWIDGKPVYQKSFDITETTIHGANAFEITLLSNVDSMISQNFMFMDEGLPSNKPIPKACWVAQDGYTHEASGYWYASYFYINPSTHELKMRRDGNSGILHLYGTILYTKTSS